MQIRQNVLGQNSTYCALGPSHRVVGVGLECVSGSQQERNVLLLMCLRFDLSFAQNCLGRSKGNDCDSFAQARDTLFHPQMPEQLITLRAPRCAQQSTRAPVIGLACHYGCCWPAKDDWGNARQWDSDEHPDQD